MRIETIPADATIDLRHKVLWPDKEKEHCIVEGDECAVHYGIFVDQELVGVASVFDITGFARLRKFAVDKRFQGRGLGTALIEHAVKSAKECGASVFWFDARENAIGFYEKRGFDVEGGRFYKSGIPYFKMSKRLL